MRFKRWLATGLAMTMIVFSLSSAILLQEGPRTVAGSFTDTPDITDDQAGQMVRDAFEKYKTHDAVLYAVQSSEGTSIFGYDSHNQVGVVLLGDYMDEMYKDVDLENSLVDWYDFKNRLFFESYLKEDEDGIGFRYESIGKKESEEYINGYFYDFIEAKEKAFPLAGEYTYDGKVLEYGPCGESHICYRIQVPESDPSRYLEDEYYLPKTIYIGVDDGEIYRIDEDRYSNMAFEYSIRNFSTHFIYPEKLVVPDSVKKIAVPDGENRILKDGVFYSMVDSKYEDGKLNATAYSYNFVKALPRIKIRDQVEFVTPNGKEKRPIREIDYEAFAVAKKLEKVVFGKNIVYVGKDAFSDCKKLQKVVFNKKVKLLDNTVFRNCVSLKDLTLPNMVSSVGDKAFSGCRGLRWIRLGKKLSSIGKKAFFQCPSLKTIYVGNKSLYKYLKSAKGRAKTGIGNGVEIVYKG